MGLDIYFNKAKALAAGMVIEQETNGDEHSVRDDHDSDYNKWLDQVQSVIQVPNADHKVNVWVGNDLLGIRANKWGSTYAPLTAWLKEHNIEWQEH